MVSRPRKCFTYLFQRGFMNAFDLNNSRDIDGCVERRMTDRPFLTHLIGLRVSHGGTKKVDK